MIFSGCSTEKNTAVTRTFHNVTSKYNIYFNANESVKAGLENVNQRIEDDFTRVLPIYKESDPAVANLVKSDMDYAVVKCSKLVEIHSRITSYNVCYTKLLRCTSGSTWTIP